ncbi:cyclic nucleotide-binding domain-containing [Trichoderma cornu-damae]|uniref:Cyclic nucleotide-binding domain-containing n=1 Tax=Trichoderma cornu-damae TaxID=654480 RepID=A0A9P8TXV1_9HYPO|nr:cyclic nucleotide-binding domain-containing [Trichoderma cornu-damae]
MRRSRSPSAPSHYRALGHQHGIGAESDPVSLIRSFNVENNPTRPMRPSPLTASTIRDMPLDLVDRIRSFPLFLSASEEFLVEIGNHLKPQVHGPNDHIITEGDDAKAMYWLVRGVVAVTSRDGEAVYAELKAGAFFGEIGVLMDMPRTATIVARTKCLLLVLKKEDLQTVMPKFPEMEKAIRQEAQERLSVLRKKRLERGATLKSPKSDFAARTTTPGEVSTGETGAIKDGAVVKSKKRKSPSPSIIEDPALGSALGSGFVNIRKTLKELPLFTSLPPDILHFLGLSVQPKTYPPFTDIVCQGTPGHEIFFVVRGEAEVIHHLPKTDKEAESLTRSIQKRPRLRTGQYFGEVASLGLSRGRTATVRSITTVECLMIPGETLDELWARCSPDIKSQVEQTAWHRYNYRDEDVDMADADRRGKTSKSDPPTPRLARLSLPDVEFATPLKPVSASARDDSEVMEPKDPDPFLSVDMENLRNRRRHSIAPPTAPAEASPMPPARPAGAPSPLPEPPSPVAPDFGSDVPAKRAKTLSHRPCSLRRPTISDSILVRILQYADIGELLRLRRVSSHWKALVTTSPYLCRHVDLSCYNRRVTDQVIIDTLAPFIGTRALVVDLNNCFHVTDEGFSVLWRTCGKNVRTWRMRSLWDVSANQILEMSENAKGLEEVDWSNCRKVGDNLLGRVVGWVIPEAPAPPAPPPATGGKVVTSSSGAKGAKGAKAKDKTAQQQQQQQQQPSSTAAPAPGTVIGCSKLNTLNLSYCKHITDRSMGHLAAHASSRLRSLSLTRCTSITDAGFQSWAQFKFEKLTHLCLADCTYLSDNAIVALVNAAKNLTHLDLSFCCALSDTATEVVALGLPKLRELRLAFCGSAVSDGSLEGVALHLNELEGLSVRGCVRVTGRGLENILRGCARLRWIDVSQCRNLEPWLRAGSVSRWGFDSRAGKPELTSVNSWPTTAFDSMLGDLPMPRTMSVAMLTTPSFFPRPGASLMGKRSRQPVKFVIEKGTDGLR